MTIIATTSDPDGRQVDLSDERWQHVVDHHPEMEPYCRQVMEAVRTPTLQLAGRMPDQQWYYLAGEGPSRWLKVVVHCGPTRGWIVTAFPGERCHERDYRQDHV